MSVETIRAAYEALAAGKAEPLVALIDPQMEWRGAVACSASGGPPH